MSANYRRWVCDACGYIYDEEKGDPDSGLQPGTRYEDIPENWMCPLCGLTRSDLRLLPDQPVAPVKPVRKTVAGQNGKGGEDYVVIVGAGIAAWSVAEEIRRLNQTTKVLIVTACQGLSYPKPALSNAFSMGKSPEELVDMDGFAKAEMLGIEIRTETRVLKIDPLKQRLTTSRGGIQYGQLVLALGAHQRELDIAGNAANQINRVNDLSSYRRFRARLSDSVRHVTIMGAGLIGVEFADDLLSGGFAVTVIDPASYPMPALLPASMAFRLQSRLANRGVNWVFGKTVDSLESTGGPLRITLSDGLAMDTDLVLSAAGLHPNTQLAEKAGIKAHHGIIVDEDMRTSVSNIFALGDCAEFEGRIYAYIEPIRRQARAIASALHGEHQPYSSRAPLIRVKTPSFPLSICLPPNGNPNMLNSISDDEDRLEYQDKAGVVGFVLSNEQTRSGAELYQKIYG